MTQNLLIKDPYKIIEKNNNLYINLDYETILKLEIEKNECLLTSQGAATVDTGIFTGRSPNDKFFVKEKTSEDNINWGKINRACDEKVFDELFDNIIDYFSNKNLYVYNGYAGARKSASISLRIITEKVWQHHFCKNMFITPQEYEIQNFTPEFTIYNASSFKNKNWERHGLNSDVFIIFNLAKKIALIGGTEYGGEMKKGIFTVMNYFKPLEGILTMHCSVNVGKEKNDSALFFGLSGTGKTTLSTDEKRPIVGDDEHGWDDEGVWNIEGGCYAKVIGLKEENEPLIYKAIKKNALLENVVVSGNGIVDYNSKAKTENTRVSYPLNHIENREKSNTAPHPKNIIFLTCDAFGVIPPVSILSHEQAMYHFISGYTAKVAGTERGVTEPTATFSACFGAAFMPLHPMVYANLLGEKILKHNVNVYLVNTGWAGGAYGIGTRMSIKLTRSILDGIFENNLDTNDYTLEPILNLKVPNKLGNIDTNVLHCWKAWKNIEEYKNQARVVAKMFNENFKQFLNFPKALEIQNSGPSINI